MGLRKISKYLIIAIIALCPFASDAGLKAVAGASSGGGGSPTGSAGGDLGGTYPNPTVTSVSHITSGNLSTANGGTGAVPYTGIVATRTGVFDGGNNSGLLYAMARNFFIVRTTPGTSLTSVKVILFNWFNGESPTGGTKTATCSIEYPAGTFNQCKFSGSTSVSIASGAMATSDTITLSTPIPNGAKAWIRQWYNNPSGISYSTNADTANDLMTFSGSSIPDYTMGGTITNTSAGISSFVYAIVGQTTLPSICALGDSREQGTISGSSQNVTGIYPGQTETALSHYYGVLDLGAGGEQAAQFISSHTNRVSLSQYCTHITDEYGINDFDIGGVNAATLIGYQQTIAGYFTGKYFYLETLLPHTTSTDSWATTVNQTVDSNNTGIQQYNAALRHYAGTYPWVTNIFDTAYVMESTYGSGKWIVNGVANFSTNDGLHPNFNGYDILKSSNIFYPSYIHYP